MLLRDSWTSRAWLYYITNLVLYLVVMFIFFIFLPEMKELINRRGKTHEDTKGWDKLFMKIAAPFYFLVPVIAGLDVGRFGWSLLGEGFARCEHIGAAAETDYNIPGSMKRTAW